MCNDISSQIIIWFIKFKNTNMNFIPHYLFPKVDQFFFRISFVPSATVRAPRTTNQTDQQQQPGGPGLKAELVTYSAPQGVLALKI